MESRKRNLLLVIILFLAVVVIGGFWYLKNTRDQVTPAQQDIVHTDNLPVSEVPAGLPENLPIEPGSQVLQNYQATASDDRIQGTRKFTTKKSLPEAVKTYTDFFAKTAWEIVDTQIGTDYQSALLKRNNSTILIVVRSDSKTGQNIVAITLTETKKK